MFKTPRVPSKLGPGAQVWVWSSQISVHVVSL